MPNQNQTSSQKSSPRKISCLIIILALLFITTAIFFSGAAFFFRGFSPFNRGNSSFDSPFTASKPRDYPLHEVSQSVLSRKADCSGLYLYKLNSEKKKNLYCANLYNVTENEIQEVALKNNYDRIVLYGEKIFFDVNAGNKSFSASRIIDLARFTDQITVPVMMELYGLEDLSYISQAYAPYPALHLIINSSEEINAGHTNKSNGYAYIYWGNATDDLYVNTPKSSNKSYKRQGTADNITIHYSWPQNCYISQGMLHELNHNFAMIKITPTAKDGYFILPNWFDEQVASFVSVVFPEYVCGQNTIWSYESTISNKKSDQNLVEFNSIMPPGNIYNNKTDWYKTECQKAIMVSWYRFLGSGDLKIQFKKYAVEMRKTSKSVNLRNDNTLASFIAGLFEANKITEVKDFLIKNGCSL
ncbi:MAG: hypothetical protein ABIC19_03705 [Patescibacteria group bacterium]|nr:hypothetical protein [Patescibacteria group bacterium]